MEFDLQWLTFHFANNAQRFERSEGHIERSRHVTMQEYVGNRQTNSPILHNIKLIEVVCVLASIYGKINEMQRA